MNHTRRSSNNSNYDVPASIVLLCSGSRKKKVCVLTCASVFVVGEGDSACIDAAFKMGRLEACVAYVSELPGDEILKFLEKSGLRQIVVLQEPPKEYDLNKIGRNQIFIDYIGSSLNSLRDMVRSLEQEAAM